ncbi:MAG: hypothetical protein A2091_11425 [Desulfuromonadales bacterium GWD2_61_12]|nr:MAG: hypothetical protein A2091_11425 [Desulfuromonadales bacterium GWD2_61_12]
MPIVQGDKVRHPKMLEWGIGKVLEVKSGGKIKVFFLNEGEKTIDQSYVQLEKIDGAGAKHPILDNPTFHERAGKKGHRNLEDAKADFYRIYPQGFEDEGYFKEERTYKVEACGLFKTLLNKDEYAQLLAAGDADEVVKRALQVVNKTNLIFPNEKMGLKDGLKSAGDKKLFAERLYDLLYGGVEFNVRFEAFVECLEIINAAKWPIATYFPYLAFPNEHMFLKPEITKNATDLTHAELNYRSELNWLTYKSLLEFSTYLRDKLEQMEMKPRDMIDVQSFMWCIAPGKNN